MTGRLTCRSKTLSITNSSSRASTPAASGVATQPAAISPSTLKRMPRPPLSSPMPRIAPTTAWLLLTGTRGIGGRPTASSTCCRPSEANRNRVRDWASTTTSAASGDRRISPPPTVRITRSE